MQLGNDGDARRRRMRTDNSDEEMSGDEGDAMRGILPSAFGCDVDEEEAEGSQGQEGTTHKRSQAQVGTAIPYC